MQPRYRSFLPLMFAAGLAVSLSCGGGAGVKSGSSLRKGDVAPTAVITGYAPQDTTLVRFKPYTFTATATDPDIGDSITRFEWDFQDGTTGTVVQGGITKAATAATVITSIGQVTHVFNSTGAATVRVRAYDSSNLAGDYATLGVTVDSSASPITAAFTSPSGPITVQADPSGGVLVNFSIQVTGAVGTPSFAFDPGDSLGTIFSSQSAGGGLFNYAIRYSGTSAASTRTATPTVQVTDSLGITSDVVTGPAITINTLAGTNHAPVILITDPATLTSAGFTTKPVNLGFTITDQDKDIVGYSVDWGDLTPPTEGSTSGDSSAGVAITLTHEYLDSFTNSSAPAVIRVNATDGRTNNGNAQEQTRTFTITFNTFPTATITSPQASATLPSATDLPSNSSIGLMNPPGPNDPDLVVIPAGGKVSFSGMGTPPGSGEPVASYSWTFDGGVPQTSSAADPGDVFFTGNPGTITAHLVELTVMDVFQRGSSTPSNVNPKTFRKWIVVDGTNTQSFNLDFLYRLKADNNGIGSVSPAKSAANGLGAAINIFQDGLTNTYMVQDQSGKAVATLPVRSNLPFFVLIPSFGDDTHSYLLRIPNAPTGPFRDPSFGTTVAANASTFGFENTSAPFNPTLKIVTGQGFAPENFTPQNRHIVGTTPLVLGTTPSNMRWIDRLAIPLVGSSDSLGALNEWVQSSNSAYGFDLLANQSFAEWVTVLFTRKTGDLAETPVADPTSDPGKPDTLGFVLDWPKYVGDTQKSETFAAFGVQAFRVPGGVTDPYDITLAGSNGANFTTSLLPEAVDVAIPPFFFNSIAGTPGSTPLAGGIQYLFIPYDANDPDRHPYQSILYPFNSTRAIFSYSEYLWSTVWARPLVLNQASLSWLDTPFLDSFPYFRRSNPTSWPKTFTGITPDNSQFDLTVSGGGTFDASSPVSVGGTPGTTGVGRFFWTAFTPFYSGSNGSVISRTWLSDAAGQPPTTFSGTSDGDATSVLGFDPPQDVVIDKRGRNADGSLNGSPTGGYRVTWFNPTKDAHASPNLGNPVPPDFWVVELQTGSASPQHFMLPANFPADIQKTTDLIMTDARTFLPSGRSAADGPAPDNSDTVGPGYCWFDIPVELRPTIGSATVTVFATKAILRNNPPAGARALNRPDWLDAIKTASATIDVKSVNGDFSFAHKIPFNFYWDIVVANSPKVFVAP